MHTLCPEGYLGHGGEHIASLGSVRWPQHHLWVTGDSVHDGAVVTALLRSCLQLSILSLIKLGCYLTLGMHIWCYAVMEGIRTCRRHSSCDADTVLESVSWAW